MVCIHFADFRNEKGPTSRYELAMHIEPAVKYIELANRKAENTNAIRIESVV